MKSNFNKFSDYRNSLGHTINSAYQDEKFIESLNILATVVTIVLRFELNKINNEKAKCWFVENRELNLKTFILPFDKENFSSLYEDLLLRSVVPKYDKDIVAELRSSHGENYPVEIVFKNYFSFEDGMYNLIFNIELSIENAHKLYKENREARKKIKSDLQSHWRNVDSWKISISGIEMHQKFRYKYIIETIPARRLGWDSSQPSKYNFQISEIIKIECYKENL